MEFASQRLHLRALHCLTWISLLSLGWPAWAVEFPVEHFDTLIEGVSWEISFDASGRYLVRREGEVVVEGDYRVDDDRIEFDGERGTLACRDAHGAGIYRWIWTGRLLIFERLDDTCPGRVFALTGGQWRPGLGGLSAQLIAGSRFSACSG